MWKGWLIPRSVPQPRSLRRQLLNIRVTRWCAVALDHLITRSSIGCSVYVCGASRSRPRFCDECRKHLPASFELLLACNTFVCKTSSFIFRTVLLLGSRKGSCHDEATNPAGAGAPPVSWRRTRRAPSAADGCLWSARARNVRTSHDAQLRQGGVRLLSGLCRGSQLSAPTTQLPRGSISTRPRLMGSA